MGHQIEQVFGLTDEQCTAMEGEIEEMIAEDIGNKRTMSSTINHVISRYNGLEKIFAAYTVGSILGMMYNVAK